MMNDIKRYSITTHRAKVEESLNGEWVSYDDVERLRAENEALRLELGLLETENKLWRDSLYRLKADAVREAVYELKKADGLNKSRLDTYDLLDYANNIESQSAKGE